MTQNLPPPPVAKVVPHTYQHLDWTLTDDYAWLEKKADPEVIAYLEAENVYARGALRHTEPVQGWGVAAPPLPRPLPTGSSGSSRVHEMTWCGATPATVGGSTIGRSMRVSRRRRPGKERRATR